MREFELAGINVTDHTSLYDLRPLCGYVEKALTCVPPEDLKLAAHLNFYDECPSHFPVIAKGSYYPATAERGAEIDIYLDQNLGRMSSLHSHRNKITRLFDRIFVHTFGKRFIADTIFHEVGHLFYEFTTPDNNSSGKEKSEEFANQYADRIYGKLHPFLQKHYSMFNLFYRLLYRHRIAHDNEIADKHIKVQRMGAPDRRERAPASR
jgi:hypothetical protein